MRLTHNEREVIRNAAHELFGPDARVRLFGSRADDNQRGGDIDLLIEPARSVPNSVLAECTLASRLHIALGGRKVDVLVKDAHIADSAIIREAQKTGVPL